MPQILMKRYIENFLEVLSAERNCSKNTIESYKLDLELFAAFLNERNKNFKEVISQDIVSYLDTLRNNGCATSTSQRKLTALRQFYTFLEEENIVSNNPTSKVLRPKNKRPIPKTLTIEMVQDLFAATKQLEYSEGVRARLILLLLYGSGLRVSELISLKLNAFNHEFLRVYGKGSKERIVPLAPQTHEVLDEYISLCSKKSLIFESKNGKPITRQRIFQILKDLAVKANIPYEAVSPHVLRHAFATHILDNGGNLLSIKKMLGHKSIATTEIYTHVSKSKLLEIVNDKHPLNHIC